MSDSALDRAIEIRDKVIEFNVFLHYNDGDSHNSREVARPLIESIEKLEQYTKHLMSVPFQPDR